MPTIKYSFKVDWSNNGSYLDSGENVSTRTRHRPPVVISRGRDQAREFSPPRAGQAQFNLENTNGDYNLDNTASPLFGNVLPGRPIQVRASAGTDHFTRANSTNSLGALEDGTTWRVDQGTWGIRSSRAFNETFTLKDRVSIDAGVSNATISCVVNSDFISTAGPSFAWPAILFRGDNNNSSNFLIFAAVNGGSGLSKSSNGAAGLTALSTGATTLSNNTDYTLKVSCDGTTINCYINSTLELSYVLGSTLGSDTVYANSSFTRVGLCMRTVGSGGTTVTQWDDFTVNDAPLFTGRLDNLIEQPRIGKKQVSITSLDGLAELKSVTVATGMSTNVTTDVAIGAVLDAAGWSTSKRSLSTGKTILARWWVDGISAFEALRDLMLTEGPGALIYVDGDGNFVFEDRHYRLLTTRSAVSQATFRSSGAEPLYQDYQFEPGLKSVINDVTVDVRSYTVAALASIWTGPTPITFSANETRLYTISTTADGFTGALNPVGGTDYTVTSGAITSATLNRSGGKTATLTIVAGAAGATITGLQVRAQTVTIALQAVGPTISSTASQAVYGKRSLPSDFLPSWIPSVNDAQDWCNAIVGRYSSRVPQAMITITNGSSARLAQALTRRISDRITIVEPTSGVNEDFMIEAVTYRLLPGGNHETILSCERAAENAYWVLGDSQLGTLGIATRLGF